MVPPPRVVPPYLKAEFIANQSVAIRKKSLRIIFLKNVGVIPRRARFR